MSGPSPELSVIVPCYNEQGNVRPTGAALGKILKSYGLDAEVLMVDDCSQDATRAEIQELSEADPRFRLVTKQLPRGMGAAIRAAIHEARGQWAVMVNGDLSDPLEAIPQFRENILRDGCDLVLLNRYSNDEDYKKIKWSYRFYQFWFRWLLWVMVGMRFRDVTYGYRAFRLDAVRRLNLESDGFEISPECSIKIYLAGGKIGEVSGQCGHRTIGKSKFYFRRVFRGYFLCLARGLLHRLHIRRLV
jgi:dolichol-phosphate mannosyltransferase